MSKSRTPKPSYILSKSGKDKLEKSVKDKSDTIIGDSTEMSRETIAKIRNCSKGVNKNSLERLFDKLTIKLEEEDYEECDRPPKADPQKLSRTSSNKDDLILNETKTEKLKNALRELNYQDQESSFTDSLVESAIAFIIHGESGYGQRWLVNRLSYKVPYYTDAFCCPLHLKRTRHRHNIETLWDDLASMVGSTTSSPQDIVKTIYQHWQIQTVMLCFRDVDVVTKEDLNQLLRQLWQPLVKMVRDGNSPENEDKYPLLLFLIDNLGIPLASQLDSSQPDTPIQLKKLEPFKKEEIKRWVGNQNQLFTPQLKESDKISHIIQDIIERNSTPVNALEVICSWCDLDWYRDIEPGLKL